MKMNSQEKQVDDTLKSLDNLIHAEANSQLYDQVMRRISRKNSKVIVMRSQVLWRAAACIAIATVLNIYTLLRNSLHNASHEKSAFAAEYFSYINEI